MPPCPDGRGTRASRACSARTALRPEGPRAAPSTGPALPPPACLRARPRRPAPRAIACGEPRVAIRLRVGLEIDGRLIADDRHPGELRAVGDQRGDVGVERVGDVAEDVEARGAEAGHEVDCRGRLVVIGGNEPRKRVVPARLVALRIALVIGRSRVGEADVRAPRADLQDVARVRDLQRGRRRSGVEVADVGDRGRVRGGA